MVVDSVKLKVDTNPHNSILCQYVSHPFGLWDLNSSLWPSAKADEPSLQCNFQYFNKDSIKEEYKVAKEKYYTTKQAEKLIAKKKVMK